MDEHRYADAVAAFEQSYALRASPVVLYNLGLAYSGAGRYQAATATLERYLHESTDTIPADDARAVRAEIDRIALLLATVHLVITPSTATIAVDGQQTSGTDVLLDPGSHVIQIEAEGFEPERREISAAPSARLALTVELRPSSASARLRIEPSIPTATVYLDGEAVGSGTTERAVTPTQHRLVVRATGYQPFERDVQLNAGGVLRLQVNLTREASHSLPRWVLPAAIGVGAAIAVGIGVAVAVGSSGTDAPVSGSWGLAR